MFNPILYTRGVESDAFYLILSGNVEVISGNEGFKISQSAFNYLGEESLIRDDYKPDFSVMAGQNKSYVSYFQGAELMMNGVRARANVQRLIEEVGRGELEVVIDTRFKLSEAAEAHRLIESRKAFGRVVMIPDEITQ